MISYLQIENLAKSYGDKMLFEGVTFGVFQGDKIGIIARNGAGKSTLLDIIAGATDYDSGSVIFRNDLKVGYLSQEPRFDSSKTLVDNVTDPNAHDRWEAMAAARRLLTKFGIDDTERPAGEYSGGQLKRAAIARVLLAEPDFLILDEPTNHLDIEMIEWLENYLTRQKTTLLMVTHDRYFLDNVCTRIIEIDRRQTYSYEGNYSYYLQKREERYEALSAEAAKVKNLLRTELEWMRRQPQARGTKAKYRIDNFHELEKRSHVNLTQRNVALDVSSSYIGSKIFEAEHVSKSFGDKVILSDWSYTFARYEKVGIVGDNGVGKSTFIKVLLGELPADSGHIDVGATVRWGYYSQDGMIDFDENKRVIDAVTEVTETVRIDDKTRITAAQFLNRFLFTPEDQRKYIHTLSGGERRRLYLATVLMKSPNFLILDEPTNDLDIVTLSVLEEYLSEFKGCVIVVSHDRFFLDRIADHLFVFKGDGVVKDFPGDYSTYRHCLRREAEEKRAAEAAQKSAPADDKQWKAKRTYENRLTFKEKREMEELSAKLDKMTEERNALEQEMSSGTLTHERLAEAGARIGVVIDEIDAAEMRLLELMEKEG